MIYDTFLPSLVIFSIFGIIMILARKIPDISFEQNAALAADGKEKPKPYLPTALFCFILLFCEKILRQIRIHILKLDTKIFSLIEYLRKVSAKKLEDANKLSHNNITIAVMKDNAQKFSKKLRFKMEEKKLLHTIARSPKKAENYKKLGVLYFENKNFRDAEASFSEYLKLNPDDLEIREMVEKMTLSKKQTPM